MRPIAMHPSRPRIPVLEITTVCRLAVLFTGGYRQPHETTRDSPVESLGLAGVQDGLPRLKKVLPDSYAGRLGLARRSKGL